MEEALQNVLDYMETEVKPLSKRDYQRFLKRMLTECQDQLDASFEFEKMNEDEEDGDAEVDLDAYFDND